MARLVWLDDQLTQAANDETASKTNIEKLNELKQIALQNIGELEGLEEGQTLPPVANDEPPKHSQHQVYWYQNDHLGTPRELTSNHGDIAWEAVYQAWGNTVSVEWQEVAQAQEIKPIQLNAVEQSYLLQPHRFQGQIYDVETGLHYNRFRYYDPDAGRFISHDPIGLLGGDNHFQYTPNPVGWVDPYGLAKKKLGDCDDECEANKSKEIVLEAKSFESARNLALKKIGTLIPGTRSKQIGRLGMGKGKVTGFTGTTKNHNFVRLRLDYDPIKGTHFNVELGKGECAEKYAIKFPGDEKKFATLLKRNT
ncbi:RHS repeat-associated core domain-containing protein [Acinetobacter lanii]|uniref:RHS repeat-associated core domain-containing protein n=1 Tax=Acinetobacter lanii TaxID=2715163 RepID=UPI00222FA9EB|nr:RHS repeat-associated core domain-containing protein [Acinetobacter lanii]